MAFRESIEQALTDEQKAALKDTLDAMDKQLNEYGSDIQKLKTELRSKTELKLEDFQKLEKDLEDNKTARATLEKEKGELERAFKKLDKEHKEVSGKVELSANELRDYKNDVLMRQALTAAKIGTRSPEDSEDALAYIKARTVHENGSSFVLSKDEKGATEKVPLAEYVEKIYPTTSHAKRFIPGGDNSGGGTHNDPGNKNVTTLSPLHEQYEKALKAGDVETMMAIKEQMSKE